MTFVTFWLPFILEIRIAVVQLVHPSGKVDRLHREFHGLKIWEPRHDTIVDAASLVTKSRDLGTTVNALGYQVSDFFHSDRPILVLMG